MNIINLQKENSIIINNYEEYIYFEMISKKNKKEDFKIFLMQVFNFNKDKTKIFDYRFVNKNKDKCKIIYKNKEFDLKKNILKILIIIKIKKMKFHLY